MIILEGFENTVFSLADIGINHYKIRNITSELDNPIPYFRWLILINCWI